MTADGRVDPADSGLLSTPLSIGRGAPGTGLTLKGQNIVRA